MKRFNLLGGYLLAFVLCLILVVSVIVFIEVRPPIHVLGFEEDELLIPDIKFTDPGIDLPSVEFTFTEDNKVDVIYHNCTPTEGVKLLVRHLKERWWSHVTLLNVDGFRKFNSGDIAWVITEEEDYVYRFIYQGGVWQLFPFTLEEK